MPFLVDVDRRILLNCTVWAYGVKKVRTGFSWFVFAGRLM
jgi:hypothetical protein